jgi:hypothetical protein
MWRVPMKMRINRMTPPILLNSVHKQKATCLAIAVVLCLELFLKAPPHRPIQIANLIKIDIISLFISYIKSDDHSWHQLLLVLEMILKLKTPLNAVLLILNEEQASAKALRAVFGTLGPLFQV